MQKNTLTKLKNKKMFFIFKVFLSALIIAGASWLSGKNPKLAGFLVALPLVTLIVLIFSYIEHKNAVTTITFAKSILVGVTVSYLFFIPFFFAKSLNMNFWLIYFIGLILLIIGYFIHKYFVSLF